MGKLQLKCLANGAMGQWGHDLDQLRGLARYDRVPRRIREVPESEAVMIELCNAYEMDVLIMATMSTREQ